MPIIKSAKKRVRTAEKAAIRNSKTKRSLKAALKSFRSSLGSSKTAETHAEAVSNVDKAVKKGLIHKNKAARMKSQLSRTAREAAADKPAKKAAKPAAKKPAAKSGAKPAAAKKPAATRKTAAKKPASK